MAFELAINLDELKEHFWKRFFHRKTAFTHRLALDARDGLWRADPGDNVFALGVDQIFAIEQALARRWVTRKGHTRSGGFAHIAKHHGLNVDGGAPAFGDVMHLAIKVGAVIHPRPEHSTDCAPQLVVHILWEWLAHRGFHRGLVLNNHFFPIFCLKVGIDRIVVDFLIAFQNVFEHVVVEFQYDIGIHLDEAAIAIKGKAAIAGLRR